MGNLFLKSVPVQPSENQLDLIWNLQPIVYSLRIFGIDLVRTAQSPSYYRRWGFVSLAMLITTVVMSSTLLRTPESLNMASTKSWSDVLVEKAMMTRNVSLPLAMLQMATLSKWKPLRSKMHHVEKLVRFPATFHRKLLQVSATSVTIILFLELLEETTKELTKKTAEEIQPISKIGDFMVDLYEDMVIALFFCLTWLASATIQLIIDQVRTDPSAQEIKHWKISYCLISNFIRGIDQFFELPLFLFIVKQFTACSLMSANLVYYKIFTAHRTQEMFTYVFLFKNALLMSVVLFAVQNMNHKAQVLIFELFVRRCDSTDQSEVTHMNELIKDIQRRPPIISPMKMFEIQPALIASFIGSTVNCIAVMAQFALTNP